MTKSTTVNVRLDPEDILAWIDATAKAEHRNRSQMIGVLLLEAREHRKTCPRVPTGVLLEPGAEPTIAAFRLGRPEDNQ